MLCGIFDVLYGSKVSILPVERSRRWTAAKPLFCDQHLAVDVRAFRPHHVHLRGVDVVLRRHRPGGELLGLRIELHDRGLIHVAEPPIAVPVGAQPERALREVRLVQRHRIFLDLAGLRIEPAEELLAEARVPGDAVLIEHDVVRRDGFAREVILGVDHARGAALGTRQHLQVERPLRLAAAEIDGAEKFGDVAEDLDALIAALLHQPRAAPHLRVLRDALVHVALHARQRDFHQRLGVVRRAHEALERVAADAAQQQSLLLVGAGDAVHPLAVRHLRGEVLGLLERQIVGGGPRPDLDRLRIVEVVADRADAQRVLAGRKLAGGEAVAALLVAHDRDGDGALLGVDQNAFHRAFLGGGDRPGQGDGVLGGGGVEGKERDGKEKKSNTQCGCEAHGRFLPPILTRRLPAESFFVAVSLDLRHRRFKVPDGCAQTLSVGG